MPFVEAGHGAVWSLALLTLLWSRAARCCPAQCDCSERAGSVDCAARGLSAVPSDLPPGTRSLHLQLNGIAELPDGAFGAVAPSLELLDVSGNGLAALRADALLGLARLRELRLANNSLRALAPGVLRHSLALRELDLSLNELPRLPRRLFYGLRNLSRLSLRRNRLAGVERDLVEPLVGLRSLQVAGNPWRCDCYTAELRSWLEWYTYRGGLVDELHCALPQEFKGRNLLSIPSEVFFLCSLVRDGSPSRGQEGGDRAGSVQSGAPPCTVASRNPPASVRRAVGTLAVAGVICGVISLMMVVAATYGCLYAAMMSKVHQPEAAACQLLVRDASDENRDAKEPLNPGTV
ncbi:leucine-rich repeat and transmembrane domain-containing protein 2 [Lampetra planeri]